MCNLIFGGSPKRWSVAWRWILFHLDNRYRDIIGHQGLLHFLDDFPRFFDSIQQRVMQDDIRHNIDGTTVEVDGLNFLPFDIFGFMDCSSTEFVGHILVQLEICWCSKERAICMYSKGILHRIQKMSWYQS